MSIYQIKCEGVPPFKIDPAIAANDDVLKAMIAVSMPEVGNATHYHATYVYPHWAPRMKKVTKIGMHVFYQFKRGWRFG